MKNFGTPTKRQERKSVTPPRLAIDASVEEKQRRSSGRVSTSLPEYANPPPLPILVLRWLTGVLAMLTRVFATVILRTAYRKLLALERDIQSSSASAVSQRLGE